jgi:hypothetical protein
MKLKKILLSAFALSVPFALVSCDSDGNGPDSGFIESSENSVDGNGVPTELFIGDVLNIQGNDEDDGVAIEVISPSRVAWEDADGFSGDYGYTYSYSNGVGTFTTTDDSLSNEQVESIVNTALADPSSLLSQAVAGGDVWDIMSELIDLGIDNADFDTDENLFLANSFILEILADDEARGALVGPIISFSENSLVISDEETGYGGPLGFAFERE